MDHAHAIEKKKTINQNINQSYHKQFQHKPRAAIQLPKEDKERLMETPLLNFKIFLLIGTIS